MQKGFIDVTIVLIVIIVLLAIMLSGGAAIKPDPMYPTPIPSGSPIPGEVVDPAEPISSPSATIPATSSGVIAP